MLDKSAYLNKKYPFPGIFRLRPLIRLGRFSKGSFTTLHKIFMLLCVPIYFLVYPFKYWKISKVKSFKHQLGIAIIIKNEQDYIKEWLDYHLHLGVDIFYIFDNDSTDKTYDILKPYIAQGLVKYHKLHGLGRQMDAYNFVINNEKKNCKYIGFFDIDEFVRVNDEVYLPKYVNDFFNQDKRRAGLALNWVMFGSSHHKHKSDEPVIKRFIYHADDSFIEGIHIKSIVNPRLVADFRNPHFAIYKKGYNAYNLLGEVVEGPFNENRSNMEIRINHYFTKSEEEFMAKRNKGLADQPGQRDIEEFKEFDRNEVLDDSLAKIADSILK